MIRVRLSVGMLDAIPLYRIADCGLTKERLPGGELAVVGGEAEVRQLADILDSEAIVLASAKKARLRRSALAGAARCRAAIERDERRRRAPIHVSIGTDEQLTLKAIAEEDPKAPESFRTIQKLARRYLVFDTGTGLALSARGRAVLAGTPPGDLVPFAHFTVGVRVRLASATIFFSGEELPGGTVLTVDGTHLGGVIILTDGTHRYGPCHPKVFYVLPFV